MKAVLLLASATAVASATLYGFAIHSAGPKNHHVGVAVIDPTDGSVTYPGTPIDDHASDAFCNVAFRPSPATYYSPTYSNQRGYQDILTIDAATGVVTNNVTMSLAYAIPASTWDSATSVILAIGIPPAGGADIVSIDPQTGVTTVLAANVGLPDIQLCEAAFSGGLLYGLWQPLNNSVPEMIYTFSLAKKAILTDVPFTDGGLNSMVLWTPPGGQPGAPQILALSYYDTRAMQLMSVDPTTGKGSVLATLPDENYSPFQGALGYDATNGLAYSVFLYNNRNNNSAYTVVVTFDTTATPVTMKQSWLNESASLDGIWSLDVGA